MKALILILFLAGSVLADQVTITGTTDSEDADIYNSIPDGSFGGRTFFRVGDGFAGIKAVVRFKNFGIPAGSDITLVTLRLFKQSGTGESGDVSAYLIWKDWIEGDDTDGGSSCTDGVTSDDWDCANNFEWDTFQVFCADNAGSDNTAQEVGGCVADSADRKATASATTTVGIAVSQYYEWTINNQDVQDMVDGVKGFYGWSMERTTAEDHTFTASENGSNMPELVIDFTPPAGQKVMIRKG